MQPTQLNDSNTLLTYSLMTSPMPVQISISATNPSLASLTFVVSCPRSVGTATVAQIEIIVPVDAAGKPPDPTNLAETAPPKSSASISSSGTDQWNVAAGIAPGSFLFTPQSGTVPVSAQSLTIEITGIQVNTLVGTALVRINEWAAPGTKTPPPVTGPPSGAATFAVAKFPYGFYAGNFTAAQPMIENGQQPTLSWTGSTNATYKILYEGNPPVDVSNLRTWSPTSTPPSPVLTHTTTFILQVSAQVDGQTATIDFNITIEVDKPSLVAHDLTVLTTAAIGAGGLGLNVNPSGNVGIGTNSTAFALGFANVLGDKIALWGQSGNNYGFGIQPALLQIHSESSATDVAFGYGSSNAFTETMRVKGNGNVGIGTTTPGSRLDVNGNVNVSGNVQTGTLVSSGTISAVGSIISSGNLSSTGAFISAGLWVQQTTPTLNAINASNNSASYPTIYSNNPAPHSGNRVTGIYAKVSGGGDWGLYTNGQVGGDGGNAMFTHLPTKRGHRVVTSPLCLEAEVHVSGNQKLSKGRAHVKFEPDVADMIVHSSKGTYRVLLTPIGQCNGLTVTEKSKTGFLVAELAGGKSNAGFDWFIIAHKPASLGAGTRQTMPAKLPRVKAPKPRGLKKKPR